MKKLYTLFAAATLALSANANLYVCGDGNDLAWTPDAPMVVEEANGAFTFTAHNVASLKISTAYGDWDTFNTGAYCAQLNADNLGTEVALAPSDGNIVLPWTGDYTFVVKADMSTIKATTTTPQPTELSIYLRGQMNDWGTPDDWKFTNTEGNTYEFNATGDHMIPAGVEFKIADGSWGQINYGPQDAVQIADEFGTIWNYNSQVNAFFETNFEGTVRIELSEEPQGDLNVYFLEGAGVANIAVENNAAIEYFNLQGVRIANPETGNLYIVRQGDKVSKVIK